MATACTDVTDVASYLARAYGPPADRDAVARRIVATAEQLPALRELWVDIAWLTRTMPFSARQTTGPPDDTGASFTDGGIYWNVRMRMEILSTQEDWDTTMVLLCVQDLRACIDAVHVSRYVELAVSSCPPHSFGCRTTHDLSEHLHTHVKPELRKRNTTTRAAFCAHVRQCQCVSAPQETKQKIQPA